jgi:hypothetical protein
VRQNDAFGLFEPFWRILLGNGEESRCHPSLRDLSAGGYGASARGEICLSVRISSR